MGLNRTVALVGLMGAGKTSVGKRLAARLGVPFKDADHEIEAAAGLTVAEIFEKHGEPEFRAGERRVIARLLADPPHILATGGGAYMDASTRAAMKDKAFTIWLRAPVALLLARVSKRQTRPLLNNSDPQGTLERLLAERTPVYAEADYVLDSIEGPHSVAVEQVLKELKARGIAVEEATT
ncbi:MAG: shikimate kinase [Alphaproteobacteria bacterium]|nr:shikimate kinase [Alphaproteobacteria bacterium]